MKKRLLKVVVALLLPLLLGSCESAPESPIPNMSVFINLSDAGMWQAYGVSVFGQSQDFIISEHKPAGFPYSINSYTGFGGVLLIYGQDPFTSEIGPVAYDLACPVERRPDVRVAIGADWEAICPVCGSHYNVLDGGGRPLSGPALADRYRLRLYRCIPFFMTGSAYPTGYIITNNITN